ncbi:cyanophycin synthetase, partial [Enterococcus faecalis]|uniref:glutamate ligase domain-containing protein n=1 Tax=Enterococcus faecalis TaxID=1351 RepID=UPI0031CD38DC
ACVLVGASKDECQQRIAPTTVPGRMESLTNTNGATVYVVYAHNYDSLKNLITFLREEHPDGRLILLLRSTGVKAISSRKDYCRVLSELAYVAVLTTHDPA